MATVGAFLHDLPVLCLLLAILLRTVIGSLHVKSVGLGVVVGTGMMSGEGRDRHRPVDVRTNGGHLRMDGCAFTIIW